MSKKLDLTGEKYGLLTVIKESHSRIKPCGEKIRYWLCKCDCGNETTVDTSSLRFGDTKSCGCLKKYKAKHHYENLRFGNLTVIKEDGRDSSGCVIWLCKCDCGNDFRTTSTYLRRGFSTSCGCKTQEKSRESHKTHGLSDNKLYQVWKNMKARCDNPNSREYHNYGGRNIKVCQEWKDNFQAFYDWAIQSGYDFTAAFGECTLDRINVNEDYYPQNCRWITNKKQQNNKRDNTYIEYDGKTKTLAEWSEITGINYSTLTYRIKKSHWSIQKALETPVRQFNTNSMKE